MSLGDEMRNIRSVTALASFLRNGGNAEYLFFWGHRATRGRLTKACLSQWYPASFSVNGVRYSTAEHFMMAEKARLFGDFCAAEAIAECSDPRKAKRLGREVRGFDEAKWAASRWEIVVAGNVAKFSQNPAFGEFLCATAGKVLVEASPYDAIWGIGLGAASAGQTDPESWKGLNLLGFALMDVRDQLLQQS